MSYMSWYLPGSWRNPWLSAHPAPRDFDSTLQPYFRPFARNNGSFRQRSGHARLVRLWRGLCVVPVAATRRVPTAESAPRKETRFVECVGPVECAGVALKSFERDLRGLERGNERGNCPFGTVCCHRGPKRYRYPYWGWWERLEGS